MPYYQEIVVDYLRESRARFVNTECCIQLNPGDADIAGPYWYCDALAIDLKLNEAYLCEVSYARNLSALVRRLTQWNSHWPELRIALKRDSGIPLDWNVIPWAFVPKKSSDLAKNKLQASIAASGAVHAMPAPVIFSLEQIVPWREKARSAAPDAPSDPDQVKALAEHVQEERQ